jgi:diguanylate cyclase (GGDEF)-like protein/PAS domain S-box-containing protein
MGNTSQAMVKETEEKPTLESEFRNIERFCKVMLDAYCLVDSQGKVIKSNAMFAQLVGQTSRQILKADSLDSLIKFSIRDENFSVSRLLQERSTVRFDQMKGADASGKSLELTIGLFPFMTNDDYLGFFLLIRDITAETNMDVKYQEKSVQSITDPLTGLSNRQFFEQYLNGQVQSIRSLPGDSEQKNLSLVMLDIDFFKKINDNYGHQAGDYVLKETSALMKTICRKTDVICRYGGEEFLAILPTTNLAGAQLVAEKIRESVAKKEFRFMDQVIPVTLSSGVALFDVYSEDIKTTLARADEALYFAKRNGRNRVAIHDGKNVC